MEAKYLITEYCPGPFYMGWHAYLRDTNGRQEPNADGSWGWVRGPIATPLVLQFLKSLGIESKGDNSCDDGAWAELARRHPIPRHRIGGKPRGCVKVFVDDYGVLTLATNEAPPPRVRPLAAPPDDGG